MPRLAPSNRRVALGLGSVLAALAAAALAVAGASRADVVVVSRSVDTGVCPFPLEVTVRSSGSSAATAALQFRFTGPSTITLRNTQSGRTVVLGSSGTSSLDRATGTVTFRGQQVWYWATGKDVPFLSTTGTGSLRAPQFVLSAAHTASRVIDPCALVAPSPPSTRPVTTRAPWGLPRYTLSQVAYAGLTPVIGALIRHDHVHLDVIVDGRKVTIPAGVGLIDPVDGGRCPTVSPPQGDCAARRFYVPGAGFSPLHTHSTSGLIHIESDRAGTFTLGEFFDEWGVRFDTRCIGGYCSAGDQRLGVFVDGKQVSGDPRNVVLTNRQEIAVVFGGPGAFRSVPSTYTGGWPGLGCGGAGEMSCLP